MLKIRKHHTFILPFKISLAQDQREKEEKPEMSLKTKKLTQQHEN